MSDDAESGGGVETTGPTEGGEEGALTWAAGETSKRVAWVLETIADNMLDPLLPPATWPGREDLIQECMATFQVGTRLDAARLIDHAVTELYATDRPDDPLVKKKLSDMRLNSMQKLVKQAIKLGRRETTYKFEYLAHPTDPKAKIERRQKMKEKVYEGVDMSHVRTLLEIEGMKQSLWGLVGGQESVGGQRLQRWMDELEKRANPETAKKIMSSMAGRLKLLPVEQLNEAGFRKLAEGLVDLPVVSSGELGPRSDTKGKTGFQVADGADAASSA